MSEKDDQDCQPWGRLPHTVVRDDRLDAAGVVAIAYRSTFADSRSPYGLSAKMLKKAVRKGFGRNVAEQAIKKIKGLGYLERHQPAPTRHGREWHSQTAIDRLRLPEGSGYQAVGRQLFDGTHSISELAALFFTRAGTRKGPHVYAREVQERFRWSHNATGKALRNLLKARLIKLIDGRKADGKFGGVAYADASSVEGREPTHSLSSVAQTEASFDALSPAIGQQNQTVDAAAQKPGHLTRGRRIEGRERTVFLTESSPNEKGERHARGAGPAPEDLHLKGQTLERIGSRTLKDWKKAECFRDWELNFWTILRVSSASRSGATG